LYGNQILSEKTSDGTPVKLYLQEPGGDFSVAESTGNKLLLNQANAIRYQLTTDSTNRFVQYDTGLQEWRANPLSWYAANPFFGVIAEDGASGLTFSVSGISSRVLGVKHGAMELFRVATNNLSATGSSLWVHDGTSQLQAKISSGAEKVLYLGTEPSFGGSGGTTNGLGVNGSYRTDWNLINNTGIQFDISAVTNASPRLQDRDWGDVTTSGSGTAININSGVVGTVELGNAGVTYAKIQDVTAASRLLGRGSAAGSGDVEEITLGSGLTMTGTTLSASGGGSATNVAFNDLTDGFTNGWATGNPAAWQPDGTVGPTNGLNLSTINVGTIVLTNVLTVDVGGTGDSNLLSQAILVGNGTNAIRELGPVTDGLAGWSNSVASVITAGSNVTISNGVISATGGSGSGETNTASNLGTQSSTVQGLYASKSGVDLRFRSIEAGTGVTLTSNANTLAISATGGTFTISTNNIGYVERSVVLVTNTEAVGELAHYTITIPGNTLGVDGDELEIHIPGTFNAYTTGTNSAYTSRWSFDSASGGADNVHVISMASTYFTQTSTDYSLDWMLRIKRIDSNTVVTSSRHFAGPHYDSGSTNIQVSALGTGWFDFDGDLGTDPADFTFYTDIVDDTRAARLKTFGYLAHKVGSLGQSNFITSVSSDFQVSSGALSLTNTTGTGRIVRESAAGGGGNVTNLNDLSDVDAATPTTNSLLVYTGTTWTKTNSPTISGGTISFVGTNAGTIEIGDAQDTPKYVTLSVPSVVQTNYTRTLPTNALSGILALTSSGPTNTAENVVTTSAGLFGHITDETGGAGVLVGSASPAFTGDPTAPTASANDNDTSIATTAYVQAEETAMRAANYWQATNAALTALAANPQLYQATNGNLTTLSGASITGSGNFMRTRTGVARRLLIPASAFMGEASEAATANTNSWTTTTDRTRWQGWTFSQTSTNGVNVILPAPTAWNLGDVNVQILWKTDALEASTTNMWAVAVGTIGDDETGGAVLGSRVTIPDVTLNDTNKVHKTAWSSAITPGGTPAEGDALLLSVQRWPGHASDTMSINARLIAVSLEYTESTTEPTDN